MFCSMAEVGKKVERATEEEKKEKSNIFNPCLYLPGYVTCIKVDPCVSRNLFSPNLLHLSSWLLHPLSSSDKKNLGPVLDSSLFPLMSISSKSSELDIQNTPIVGSLITHSCHPGPAPSLDGLWWSVTTRGRLADCLQQEIN